MSSLERWEPFREMVSLRDAVQNLLAESLAKPDGEAGTTLVPAVDVHETPEAYEVQVSMPGIKPEDVQVTVHGNTLTINGESKFEEKKTEGNWIVRERRHGKFSRSMTLPCSLDSDKAVAKTENGVVKLHLPKAEKERPRQIKVGS
jgi:HSP20 family protein